MEPRPIREAEFANLKAPLRPPRITVDPTDVKSLKLRPVKNWLEARDYRRRAIANATNTGSRAQIAHTVFSPIEIAKYFALVPDRIERRQISIPKRIGNPTELTTTFRHSLSHALCSLQQGGNERKVVHFCVMCRTHRSLVRQ